MEVWQMDRWLDGQAGEMNRRVMDRWMDDGQIDG